MRRQIRGAGGCAASPARLAESTWRGRTGREGISMAQRRASRAPPCLIGVDSSACRADGRVEPNGRHYGLLPLLSFKRIRRPFPRLYAVARKDFGGIAPGNLPGPSRRISAGGRRPSSLPGVDHRSAGSLEGPGVSGGHGQAVGRGYGSDVAICACNGQPGCASLGYQFRIGLGAA